MQLDATVCLLAVRIVRDGRTVVEARPAEAATARLVLRVHPLPLVVHLALQIATFEPLHILAADGTLRTAALRRVLVHAVLLQRRQELWTVDMGTLERCRQSVAVVVGGL